MSPKFQQLLSLEILVIRFIMVLLALNIAGQHPRSFLIKSHFWYKVIFDVIRKNNVIGSHEIVFSEKDDYIYIKTIIDVEVKIFFVTAYEFFHESTEGWKNGNFIKINAYSDFEDEREYFIKGEIKDDFFFASGMDGELK